MYWSPEQTSVYNDIALLLKNPVSLDAAGSICFRIKRPGGESSDIYLSQIVTNIYNMIVPVAQFLLEKNDT